MPTGMELLPPEILDEILTPLSFDDIKNVRAAIPTIKDATSPHLFKDYYMGFSLHHLDNLDHASNDQIIAASIRTLTLDIQIIPQWSSQIAWEKYLDLRPRFSDFECPPNDTPETPLTVDHEQIARNERTLKEQRKQRERRYARLSRKGNLSERDLNAAFLATRAYRTSQVSWDKTSDKRLRICLARLPNLHTVKAVFDSYEDLDCFTLSSNSRPPWKRLAKTILLGPDQWRSGDHYDGNTSEAHQKIRTKPLTSLIQALDHRARDPENRALATFKIASPYSHPLLKNPSRDSFSALHALVSLDFTCQCLSNVHYMTTGRLLDQLSVRVLAHTQSLKHLTLLIHTPGILDTYHRDMSTDMFRYLGAPVLPMLQSLRLRAIVSETGLLNFLTLNSGVRTLKLEDCALIETEDDTRTWLNVFGGIRSILRVEEWYFDGLWDCVSNHDSESRTWFVYGLHHWEKTPFADAVNRFFIEGVELPTLDEDAYSNAGDSDSDRDSSSEDEDSSFEGFSSDEDMR